MDTRLNKISTKIVYQPCTVCECTSRAWGFGSQCLQLTARSMQHPDRSTNHPHSGGWTLFFMFFLTFALSAMNQGGMSEQSG